MNPALAGPGPAVPAQQSGPDARQETDPLLHPDPAAAADHAATESLLRCWVRERGIPAPADGLLHLPVAAGAARLTVPVRHWSAVGWHRFGPAVLTSRAPAPGSAQEQEDLAGAPVDAVTVAALLTREAGARAAADVADLTGRVADSVRRTARFLAHRRRHPEPTPHDGAAALPFLEAEQALLLGHPLHPTPKSRDGLGDAETAAYSPELRGSFRLHWFAVDRSLVATDSALDITAPRITEQLLDGTAPLPPGTVALPLHPWQARELALRPGVRALLEQGRLYDLGPHGAPWHPTSSVRTVCRPGTPWMLKLSLGLRITNSRRENLRKELHRGVEVHRLLESGLAAEWHSRHPCFDIVRDPAWLGVDLPGATRGGASGLDTGIRMQPFGPEDRALCVAGLVAERPLPDPAAPGREAVRSHLADLLHGLARRTGRELGTVATEWFLRYLDAVVLPVLWLDGRAGVALEAHQQNSLVLLDRDGWPIGGRYRDNQGYYFRRSRAGALEARLPGIGALSDTFVDDAVADERFAYYLGINHLLGLIGAFGSQRLADERLLLAALRRFLAAGRTAATGSTLAARLLDSPTLRCKANLLTRLHGMDELVGPVETQSVYVTVPNPLAPTADPPAAGHGTAGSGLA